MGKVDSTRTRWIMAGLALLMVATRFHHLGTPFALPDASLAVFFLLGWYSRNPAVFAVFLLESFAIDYVAIVHGGVSGYCVTPAYAFLVPTYAAMWWAGRWSVRVRIGDAFPWLRVGAALPISVTVAFIVSNGSFFLFSGRLPGADWIEYSLGVTRDYPAYLATAAIYCGLVLFFDELARITATIEQRLARFK